MPPTPPKKGWMGQAWEKTKAFGAGVGRRVGGGLQDLAEGPGSLFEGIGSELEAPLRSLGDMASRAAKAAAAPLMSRLFHPPELQSGWHRQPTGASVRMGKLAPPDPPPPPAPYKPGFWETPSVQTAPYGTPRDPMAMTRSSSSQPTLSAKHTGVLARAKDSSGEEVPGTVVPKKPQPDFAQSYWKFQQFQSALTSATGHIMKFAEKASPTHVNTLMTSIDLVSAKLGRVFLPAIELISRALQDWAAWMDQYKWVTKGIGGGVGEMMKGAPTSQLGGGGFAGQIMSFLGRDLLAKQKFDFGGEEGMTVTDAFAGWLEKNERKKGEPEPKERGWGSFMADQVRWMMGIVKKPDVSFAGFPKPQVMTTEEYLDRLVTASLDLDAQQVKILQEQLENFKDLGGKIDKLDSTVASLRMFR